MDPNTPASILQDTSGAGATTSSRAGEDSSTSTPNYTKFLEFLKALFHFILLGCPLGGTYLLHQPNIPFTPLAGLAIIILVGILGRAIMNPIYGFEILLAFEWVGMLIWQSYEYLHNLLSIGRPIAICIFGLAVGLMTLFALGWILRSVGTTRMELLEPLLGIMYNFAELLYSFTKTFYKFIAAILKVIGSAFTGWSNDMTSRFEANEGEAEAEDETSVRPLPPAYTDIHLMPYISNEKKECMMLV